MSSFIVSDKTIDQIITGMIYIQDFQDDYLSDLGLDLTTQGSRNEFGQDLLDMNQEAFKARYGDEQDEFLRDPQPYKFRISDKDPRTIAGQAQAIKSLRCLLYQCTEGDIDESPLYKTMELISYYMSFELVKTLPEYDKAGWED